MYAKRTFQPPQREGHLEKTTDVLPCLVHEGVDHL